MKYFSFAYLNDVLSEILYRKGRYNISDLPDRHMCLFVHLHEDSSTWVSDLLIVHNDPFRK